MKISYNEVSITLEDSLKEFDFYDDTHFILFEKDNLLDLNTYHKLKQEIYEMNHFDYIFKNKGEKKKFTVNGNNINELRDGVFKDFCNIFLKISFFKWFKKTHLPYFELKKKLYFYIKKPKSYFFIFLRKIRDLTKLPIIFYHTDIEYSSITMNGYIPPHTDAKNKRLSFVYYIPSEKSELNNLIQKDLGTVYWKPKLKNHKSLNRFDCALLTDTEREQFYQNYEPFHISKYEPNKFSGFIKSDNTWHTVENIRHDCDRRAIVINIWES